MASGDITISGSIGAISLTQALAPVSQSVTFQGPSISIVAQDDSLSQLLFQQGLAVDAGSAVTFTNNGGLGSGLDTALTAGSLSLAAGSSFQQTGGADIVSTAGTTGGAAGVTLGSLAASGAFFGFNGGAGGNGYTGGDGGSTAVTMGSFSLDTGSQALIYGGAGGNGASQGGAGGSVLMNAGSMGLTGMGTVLYFGGGSGGGVTASVPGPAQTGAGGSVSFTANTLSIDSQAFLAFFGGNSGNSPLSLVANGGNGGGVSLSVGSLSLTNGGHMSVIGGTGGQGSYSSGSGGSLSVTLGSVSQGNGSSFLLEAGGGTGNGAGGSVNLDEGSQTLSAGATFLLGANAGGSGGVTGGNGGTVNVQSQSLTLASGSLWQATGSVSGTGTSVNGTAGSLLVAIDDLEGSGTVDMSGGGTSTLELIHGNFAGSIQGTENLLVTALGGVTLTGNNTYTGGTLLSFGTLAAYSDSNLGTGDITLDNGTLEVPSFSSSSFSTSKAISLTSNGGFLNASLGGGTGGLNDFDGVISGTGGLGIDGSGNIVLNAVNTYTGPTTVLSGVLVLGDASHPGAQVAGPVSVSNTALLQGNGSILGALTNNGEVEGGSNNNGTLTVASYDQTSNGMLLVSLTPAQASLLGVNGSAALDGYLSVSAQTANYGVRYQYVILSADSITGQFSTPGYSLPANFAPLLAYGSTAVTFTMFRTNADFTTWASGANQTALGNDLNGLVTAGAATDSFYNKLNELYLLPSGQGAALGQMTGSLYTAVPGVLLDNLQFEDSLLFDRLEGSTGAGMPGAQAAVAGGILSAEVQGPAANASGLANPTVRGLWLENTDSAGSVNGDSNVGAFNKSNYGFLAGYDMELSKGFVGGVMGGYTHTDVTSTDASAKAGVDEIQFGIYGNKKFGGVEIALAAAYGVDHFKDSRTITLGTDVNQVAGTYDGSQIQAALQGDYPLDFSGFTVKPLAGFQYAHLSENAFTETGSDSLALGVPARGYDSIRPYLGVEGTKYFALDQDLGLLPRLNLSTSQELANAAPAYQATLNGAPESPFDVTGLNPSATVIGLEAGAKLVFGKQFNLFANYQGHFSGTQNLNTFNGGLDLAF